jgi:hypothetical protein
LFFIACVLSPSSRARQSERRKTAAPPGDGIGSQSVSTLIHSTYSVHWLFGALISMVSLLAGLWCTDLFA